MCLRTGLNWDLPDCCDKCEVFIAGNINMSVPTACIILHILIWRDKHRAIASVYWEPHQTSFQTRFSRREQKRKQRWITQLLGHVLALHWGALVENYSAETPLLLEHAGDSIAPHVRLWEGSHVLHPLQLPTHWVTSGSSDIFWCKAGEKVTERAPLACCRTGDFGCVAGKCWGKDVKLLYASCRTRKSFQYVVKDFRSSGCINVIKWSI